MKNITVKIAQILKLLKLSFFIVSILPICILLFSVAVKADYMEYSDRFVTFNYPDQPYTQSMAGKDFGNLRFYTPTLPQGRSGIVSNILWAKFIEGRKDQAINLHFKIPARRTYNLEWKIKFAADYENGLHGKMMGLYTRGSYGAGNGKDYRDIGGNVSCRISYDVKNDYVYPYLYLYYTEMTGKYGNDLGTRFDEASKLSRGGWHKIRLRLTMESSADSDDGHIEIWIDGSKKHDLDNVNLVKQASGLFIEKIKLSIFLGGGGVVPTKDNFVYVDDIKWWDELNDQELVITKASENTTANAGDTAVFKISASSPEPMSYQWQENRVDIPGATGASYTIPTTLLSDNGKKYRCIVQTAYKRVTSAEAVLTVVDGTSARIIDDDDPEASSTGTWQKSSGLSPYGRRSLYSRNAGDTYSWESMLTGPYEIALRWTGYGTRCADVPVKIYDGDVLLDTVHVNQRQNSGKWHSLESYDFSGRAKVAVMVESSACSTCADAVEFRAVE